MRIVRPFQSLKHSSRSSLIYVYLLKVMNVWGGGGFMDILFNNIPELKDMPTTNSPNRHKHTDIQIIKCGIHIRACNLQRQRAVVLTEGADSATCLFRSLQPPPLFN